MKGMCVAPLKSEFGNCWGIHFEKVLQQVFSLFLFGY